MSTGVMNKVPGDFNHVDLNRSEATVRELRRLAKKLGYTDDVKFWESLMRFQGWLISDGPDVSIK